MNVSSSVSSLASNIFSKLDTKKQGYIEKSDLQDAFSKIDSNSSSSEADALFSKFDGDQDGKLTESELTTGINNLVDQLNSQLNSARTANGAPPPPPNGQGPKGPPPEGGDDAGFTKDELTKIASTTDDSKLSALMNKVAENFEAADTNEDGKVSAQEAIAYQQKSSDSASGSSSDSSSSGSTTVANKDQLAAQALAKIAQLIEAYGLNSDGNSNSASVSATA